MKEIVIISGKGGTGKTSLTAAFASLGDRMVLCDADVDAADMHLLMAPEIVTSEPFKGGNQAVINQDLCTGCGRCRELCRFDAVTDQFVIDEINCEGCGVCVDLCPEGVIDFPEKVCGEWFLSETRYAPMVHARLGIAEENSGKLVSLVRKEAREYAEANGYTLILTDGPPGTGCPVIAAIGGATSLVVVTEPTVSGIHDMDRVISLAEHFRIPTMICINKCDLNPEKTEEIERFATDRNLPVVGRIPFDPAFTEAMIRRETLPEYKAASRTGLEINTMWKKILGSVQALPDKRMILTA